MQMVYGIDGVNCFPFSKSQGQEVKITSIVLHFIQSICTVSLSQFEEMRYVWFEKRVSNK